MLDVPTDKSMAPSHLLAAEGSTLSHGYPAVAQYASEGPELYGVPSQFGTHVTSGAASPSCFHPVGLCKCPRASGAAGGNKEMHMEIQQPPVKVTSVLQTCCACHWGLPAAPLLLGGSSSSPSSLCCPRTRGEVQTQKDWIHSRAAPEMCSQPSASHPFALLLS